ncbi:Metallo-hydrolase/oxidoreductase [Amylocystis lapponica]|nr:Metallo-hydrolase/oxidoreductase [Amylocystis lapponica]
MSLPPPAENQAYCDVSALEGGHITLPLSYYIESASDAEVISTPSLAFILHHSTTKAPFLFDLGIRRDWEELPPILISVFKQMPTDVLRVPQDVVQSLAKGGYEPSQITNICPSHVHFDHVGNPTLFTKATFLLGEGNRAHINPGAPQDPNSIYPNVFPAGDRTVFLSAEDWKPVGPFPRALDFYGDGSLYIVEAPGHMAGHLNVLARTSPDGGWIYLAGDSAHDWRLIRGEAQIAVHPLVGCVHGDKAVAQEHIGRVKTLSELARVRVILAHDVPWYEVNQGGSAFWPGKIESL